MRARIWTGTEMIYPEDEGYDYLFIGLDGEPYEVDWITNEIVSPPEYVILWSTGRKDVNNIEIYDGDHIKAVRHGIWDVIYDVSGYVSYFEEESKWVVIHPDPKIGYYDFADLTDIEITVNKYEQENDNANQEDDQ